MIKHGLFDSRLGQVDLLGIVVIVLIVGVVFAFVAPVFIRTGCHCGQKSNCESNMKQIGAAIKMYLQDWHDTYPTNRPILAGGKVGRVSADVELTPPAKLTPPNRPRNLTWVEALYPYMEPPADMGNGKIDPGAWACRVASKDRYPADSKTACVSYVFNRNLIERPESCLRVADRTMIVREADRMLNSDLRPSNYSCGNPDAPPVSPFLTREDSRFGSTTLDVHSGGSHVLFADSHVQWVKTDGAAKWDPKTRTWQAVSDNGYAKSTIRITP